MYKGDPISNYLLISQQKHFRLERITKNYSKCWKARPFNQVDFTQQGSFKIEGEGLPAKMDA